ncbi:glycosyl transferase family 2 [Rhodococcus sp. SRB_17]|uniref:glycosyltransferase n=1 Tax=Rhodococcus sp. OK302 TaxID=1882769 RepID=UPI000B93F89B|nr:glycosyltransferase [Rhodococcus sp. OK302]NMM91641.1 glycosyl transferase family 2 [Rhodococcus sp. SRB_17]OYD70149.1 glycosyl transferase family 2 [Rhodococcus sp. OK302]
MSEFDVALHRALKKLQSAGAVEVKETPPHGESVDLTIAIATYDDFDGAYFTIHSILTHHREVLDRVEFVLLDNFPEGLPAPMLESFAKYVPRFRYIPFTDVRSTAVRDILFRKATGKYVLVLDSHVILAPGSLASLLAHFDADPDTDDLIQGPMLSQDSSHIAATHMEPRWKRGMFGAWGVDPRAKENPEVPFEIDMQGLGSFACRREAWPGLNEHFTGFGGEEGYIHEKFRINGGKVICLPRFRWLHRFERPLGVPYRINWPDRIHNYLLGWQEIGWDVESVHRQFSIHLGGSYPNIRREAELRVQRPELIFGGVLALSDDRRIAPWRSCLGEAESIGLAIHRALPADETPDPWRIASAFVSGVDKAILLGWKSVVFLREDQVIDGALAYKLRNIDGELIDSVDAAVIHSVLDDFSDSVLVVRASAYQGLRDQLSGMIADAGASVFDLPTWLLLQGATDVVLRQPLTSARVASEIGESTATPISTLGVAVVNLDIDIDRWNSSWQTFNQLLNVTEVVRLSASEDRANPEVGFAASWRRAIALAAEKEWGSVLVTADDVDLLDASSSILESARTELEHSSWDVVQLGHDAKSRSGSLLDGSSLMRAASENRGVHAVLVHSRAFERILDSIPDPNSDVEGFTTWAGRYRTIGDFLVDGNVAGTLTCCSLSPGIATNRDLLRAGAVESDYSQRFTLGH